jgi:S-layer protein
VDAFSGGAGDDTFAAIMATASTYTVGDSINGGSGTDTLNIIDVSGTAASVVSLDGVEIVNVRSLVATGTDVTELDASDWDGVTKLTNASSIAGSELQVSGLSISTNVNLVGNTDISIEFSNTTTANAAATLVGAGTFAGVTTYGVTGVTSNATAHLILDATAAGRVSAIAVELSGDNLANIEAGANVEAYTITGNGSAVLFTDDTLISVDASGYAGSLDITLSGVSDVVAKGGAGNDTFRFGTTYNNSDSFDGGAGTDTFAASIAGFNRNLNTTNVENATLTFTDAAGGDVNASASTVTSFTFAAGTADNAASVSQIADGSTITLNDNDLGDVTLDYASGATTTTLNIGSVSGTVAIGTLAITDVATVTINSVGATAGATIGTATFDSDVKAINITTSGSEADLTIGTDSVDGSLGGATSLTVTSNGSAAITFNNLDLKGGSTLANVTISANGTNAADVTLGDVSGSAITSIVMNAVSGADIVVGTLDLGNNSTAGASQDITVSITQGDNSDVTIGAITVTSQGTTTINVTSNGTGGDLDIAAIVLDRAANVTADSAPLNLSFGSVSVGASATYAVESINAENAGTGAQITFGDVTVGDNADWSAGPVSGTATINVDISSITLTVGSGASADLGAIDVTAGAVGAISVTLLGTDASAGFGAVAASSVGTHTIIAGSGAGADFGAIAAFSAENANQGRVGAFEIAGVDAADVTFSTIAASAVGAISVSGALDVTFGTITTTTLGEVNATGLGVSGAFTIDLSGVTNAVEVKLGAATNTIISGLGNDVITLLSGRTAASGNDAIRYTTATQGTDSLVNFIAGASASGGDHIELGTGIFDGPIRAGNGASATGTVAVDLTVAISGATTIAATDNILVLTTALANTAAMIGFVASGITFTSAIAGSGNVAIAWTDGSDTIISLIHYSASGTTTLAASTASMTVASLAVISGVTPGALVAANFDFV